MFKTIIMAYDGSAGSERVLLYAEHVARTEHAEIIVVHAYEAPKVYEWTESYDAFVKGYERIANEVTDDAVQALRGDGVNAMSDVRVGPPVRAILEAVGFHQADMIVMGGRAQKRDNVTEALLGSVSTAVLRYANCPVLVVP